MKISDSIIFWNILIFLVLVLSVIFFPRCFGVEDYILSYFLFVCLLTFAYSASCLATGIFFSLTRRHSVARGFYLSGLSVAVIGIPALYAGIFLRHVITVL